MDSTWAAATSAAMLLCAAGCGRNPRHPTPSEQLPALLESKVRAEWQAFKGGDREQYGKLLADDFLAVEVDAQGTRTRAQAMDEVGKSRLKDCELSLLKIRRLGEADAMVTYEAFYEFQPPAQVPYLRVYVTEIWEQRPQDWLLVHYQETHVR